MWSQLPRWPAVILAFWYLYLYVVSSHNKFMVGLCDREIIAEVSVVWLLRVNLKNVWTSVLVS